MAYPVQRRLTRVSGLYGPRKPIALGGGKFSPSFHGGVDFTPLERGTRLPTYAVGRGVVTGINLGSGAAGLNVMIRLDGDGSYWWYGHLSRVDVKKGQRVVDGQQLGLIGATGNTTGVHLHLERHSPRIDADTDPWPYIEHERDVEGLTSSWQTGNPTLPVGDTGTSKPTKTAAQIEEEELMAAKDDIIRALKSEIGQAMEVIRRESRPRLYKRKSTGEVLVKTARGDWSLGPWPSVAAMRAALPLDGRHLVTDQEEQRVLVLSDAEWNDLLAFDGSKP